MRRLATRTARSTGHGHGNGSARTPAAHAKESPQDVGHDHDYVVPILHLHLSERAVDVGFWAALAGAALFGVVDLPVAALVGGSIVIARRHARG